MSKVFIRVMMCGGSQEDWNKMSEILAILHISNPDWIVTGPTTERCEEWSNFYDDD